MQHSFLKPQKTRLGLPVPVVICCSICSLSELKSGRNAARHCLPETFLMVIKVSFKNETAWAPQSGWGHCT